MKNQYFGDIGDYGKYGMLRYLAENNIKIAVNWYLTEDDGSNDGKHISYLDNDKDMKYDPELFEILKELVENNKRNIYEIQKMKVIKHATYYNELINNTGENRAEKRQSRENWHKKALDSCKDAELVFLDPDNGCCENEPLNAKDATKYCYANEVADYYNRGQDVVYYCQKGRRTYAQWEETKSIMKRCIPDARIAAITFHRGTQTTYIFVLHREKYRMYAEIMKKFLRKWDKVFTEEYGRNGNWSGEKTGERFKVSNSEGIELLIEERDDGWVDIRFSDRGNSYVRMSIDDFMRRLR